MQPNYRPALEAAQRALGALDPEAVAERSGATLHRSGPAHEFRLNLLSREYRIPMPEALVYDLATGSEAGVSPTLIALHYLATADGSLVRHDWVPFRALPGGNVYEAAFRQQCLVPLVSTFGNDTEALKVAADALNGQTGIMGDLSYVFQALPRLPMALVLWLPDEEQGAEVTLLYDAVAPHYLPTEDLAALGRALAFGLMKTSRRAA